MSRGAGRALPGFGEREAVRLFASRFGTSARGVTLGIGDDAAVVELGSEPLVLTVDACVEGTHFERGWLSLRDLGWKAFHAAASDLAAMGATPRAALSALELPRRFGKSELDALCRGQAEAARSLGCPLVGGNLARSERLSITTSLVGTARRPLARSGARPGDELWLVGEVGLAALGLQLLREGSRPARGLRPAYERAVQAWRRPSALVERGLLLIGRARAVIDVSDGLGGDAAQLAEASGVRVLIEERRLARALPAELVRLSEPAGRSALDFALQGGEDYALVAAGPAARRPRWARPIGRIERGRGALLLGESGTLHPLGRGFDHFAR